MMLIFYLWVMGWSGKIKTRAWNKQANIIKEQQRKQHETLIRNEENFKYLVPSFLKPFRGFLTKVPTANTS